MKRLLELVFVSLISVAITLAYCSKDTPTKPWSNGFNNNFGCSTEQISDMYTSYVEQWKQDIANAFDRAEKEVFKNTPTPDVVGPHPDPDKCICKGSGVIRQGDGHTTPCPYHGSKHNTIRSNLKELNKTITNPLIIEEE